MARRVFKYQIPGTNIGISLERVRDTQIRYQELAERCKSDRPFANSLLFAVECIEAFLTAVCGPHSSVVRQTWNRYAQHHNGTLKEMLKRRGL